MNICRMNVLTDSILTRRLIIMGNNQTRINAIHENALNLAWQNGFNHAYSPDANTTNNPYTPDTELSECWLRGYENAMNLLYANEEE